MLGKIEYYNSDKRYGFIVVRHESGFLEKFFLLGDRLLFEDIPQAGDAVEFDVTAEKPRRDKGYPLVANVKAVSK